MKDFTLDQYQLLCKELFKNSYHIITVSDYLINRESIAKEKKKIVILRHDVDRWINNALNMAGLEKKLDIKASYYFRFPATFHQEIISTIHEFGHEIGYHYEVLSKTKGDIEHAWFLFQKELDSFREIVPIHSVSMHGMPLSPYDNRDLWKRYSPDDIGIIGEAYDVSGDIIYFTDTGRRWDNRNNIRDRMPHQKSEQNKIRTTLELLNYIREEQPPMLYINVHPERWNDSFFRYGCSYLLDITFSIGKLVVRAIRK